MRQNTLWVLVGVGFLACAWEEDIAKDSDAIDDEAGFAVREACECVCGLENECGSGVRGLPFSSCDFSGEDYDCGSLDDCADTCVQDTAAYLDQGEPCASNWMLVMNCLRSAP